MIFFGMTESLHDWMGYWDYILFAVFMIIFIQSFYYQRGKMNYIN